MSVLRALCFVLMVPGFLWAQTAPHPADSSTNSSDVETQLNALREALLRTEQQVAAQQQEIQALKAQLKGGESGTVGGALVSTADVGRPSPTGPDSNPSDLSPEIHNRITNPGEPI